MIVEKLFITAKDGKKIYYHLANNVDEKSDSVIIAGHGLGGHAFAHIHQVSSEYFVNNGYDSARISFYCDEPDARHLRNCTVQINADDLNDLITHLKNDYENVFYCGHSYGGLTALLAKPNVNATALWDGTYLPDFFADEITYITELNCYKLNYAIETLIGSDMFKEVQDIATNKKRIVSEYSNPVLICKANANLQIVMDSQEMLFQDIAEPKEMCHIDGASHSFIEHGTALALSKATLKWFDTHK